MKECLKITNHALHHLQKIMKNVDTEYIRLSLNKRGCNGLSYSMKHTNTIEKNDEIVKKENIKILIAPGVLLKIIGTTMDYETNRLRSEFVFKNPQSIGECGCGESFQIR